SELIQALYYIGEYHKLLEIYYDHKEIILNAPKANNTFLPLKYCVVRAKKFCEGDIRDMKILNPFHINYHNDYFGVAYNYVRV
ncbi:MAG: hypothetical protein ABEH43_09455, partial [Flavobacteriales bacterium]